MEALSDVGETRNSREHVRTYSELALDIQILSFQFSWCLVYSDVTTCSPSFDGIARHDKQPTCLCSFRDRSEVNDSALREMSSYLGSSGEASATLNAYLDTVQAEMIESVKLVSHATEIYATRVQWGGLGTLITCL